MAIIIDLHSMDKGSTPLLSTNVERKRLFIDYRQHKISIGFMCNMTTLTWSGFSDFIYWNYTRMVRLHQYMKEL